MTTKEELDAVLATADQITVEGDDELLSYAVNKAAGDPENRMDFYFRRQREYQEEFARSERRAQEEFARSGHRNFRRVTVSSALNPSLPPHRRLLGVVKWLLLFLAVVGLVRLWPNLLGLWPKGSTPPIGASPFPELSPPPAPRSEFWANLPFLIWPLVAIVAIVALFLIARQAISSGSNVTISWKVTEKVSGRVVITKVRERASSKRAA